MPTRPPGRQRGDAGSQRLDDSHDLVARHDRQADVGKFAVDDVQVGTADAAGLDPHADLTRAGQGLGSAFEVEGPAGGGEDHCLHDALPRGTV